MIDAYIKNLTRKEHFVIFFFGILLIIAGLLHGFHVFGMIPEKSPYFLGIYFDALTIGDIIVGLGFLYTKGLFFKRSLQAALVIAFTNIPANAYMIYLDVYTNYQSGYLVTYRLIDIAILLFGLWYIRKSYLPNN